MTTNIYDGYDAELTRYDNLLHRSWDIAPGDHVVDIGCGAGHTTRQAARSTQSGSAFGVDISAPAIARAREVAQTDRLRNVTFEIADAQVYPFPPGGFDVAISRFGTMFFDHPVAAFTNIKRAMRPGGRLVMMTWQSREHSEWSSAIREALGTSDTSTPASSGPNAFSLADPPTVTATLESAGFIDIAVSDVREPVYYGRDVATALDWIRSFATTSSALAQQDSVTANQTLARLRDTLAAHLLDDGVWFDSRAWIVAARRACDGD
jgi:SAM-dependent methyltransferase